MRALPLRCPRCERTWRLEWPPAGESAACSECGAVYELRDGVLQLDECPGGSDYPERLHDIDAGLEASHWWWRSRNAVILDALRAWEARGHARGRLLEVGCGTGFVLAALADAGWDAVGLDMQQGGLAHAARRCDAPLLRSGSARLPLAEPVDLLVLCDVLEHAEEAPLLAEARAAIAPGGGLLLTVPGRPSLWSAEDVAVGHLRRYTPRTLRAALRDNGFDVQLLRPFHAWLTPLAWRAARRAGPPPAREEALRRLIEGRREPPSAKAGAVFGALCALERRIGRWIPLPFGSHLLALATPR